MNSPSPPPSPATPTLAEQINKWLQADPGTRYLVLPRDLAKGAIEQLASLQSRLAEVERDAARYRWLRAGTRAKFDDASADTPQLVFTKRSAPFIRGYAERVDAAIDAASVDGDKGEGK